MKHAVTGAKLAFSFVLLLAGPAFTQTLSDEATPEAIAAASVAHVYVQTHKGVDVYDATAAGKLTLVKGSPFADTGQMEGINGKYLISVGTDYLHTYAIASNGAVGKQASEINTQTYDGAECGSPINNGYANGSVLDHAGKYLYVLLYDGYNTDCAAWQSYEIGSNGSLHFLGSMEDEASYFGNPQPSTLPTISSNDKFGYAAIAGEGGCRSFSPYVKIPDGQLEKNSPFSEIDPEGDPNGAPWYSCPINASADPAGHLAVLMYFEDDPPYGNYGPWQLASYTIDDNSTGSITSTNTWLDMPASEVYGRVMETSPSGKLLALAGGGDGSEGDGSGMDGLQIFHFNGAAPITEYSALLLPAVEIDQLGWDNDNHLYALSYSSGELYVYTVTPTEIREASGSPYKVENAYGISGLIVVPKLEASVRAAPLSR